MGEIFTIKNPSDVKEIEKVPCQERIQSKNTFEAIEQGAAKNPEAIAISFMVSGDAYEKPVQISYAALMKKIIQSANMFYDLGIRSNDVVTYLLPNLPQTHYVLWGAEAAGIVNPINPLLEPATIRDICRCAKTKVLVALGDIPGTNIWKKVMAIRNEIPTLQHILCVMGPADKAEGIKSFEEMLNSYPDNKLQFSRKIAPDDISSLYHTGGTTGTPKLAKRTHFNEVFMAWDIQAAGGITQKTTLLCGLPLFHVNGTTVTGLTPFSNGSHVVLLSPSGYRDASVIKNFYKIVERYKAEFFSSVPTVLSALLDVPVGNADISSLKYAICGAAPLSVEMFKRFEKHTGMKILEGYGLTEGACASAINPKDGDRKVGSIGISLPYQEVKVVILDENQKFLRDAKINEIGIIAIKGPNIFKGYVEDAHNQGIWLADEWFNSGDLGRMDKDGYFWLTGRKKELIIRGGHNIDPAAIEETIYKMPDVKVVAAVGQPDSKAGEVPVAYVQLAEGSKLSSDQILEFAKANIGEKAAMPKAVNIISTMPLTPVGKIFKPALRWDAIKQIYSKELEALGDLVQNFSITVGEDKVHGTIALIQITPAVDSDLVIVKERIRNILSLYTIKYEVKFS